MNGTDNGNNSSQMVTEINTYSKFSELDVILGMFNPKIFDISKKYINILRTKYSKNDMHKVIISVFDEMRDRSEVTRTSIALKLKTYGVSDSACQYVLSAYDSMMNYSDQELSDLRSLLKEDICTCLISYATTSGRLSTSIIKDIQEIDLSDIETDSDGSLEIVKFTDIDATSVEESVKQSLTKSSLSFLNDLAPMGAAYYDRMLIMVVGSPGAGKSLLLMQEALAFASQGKKVAYAALGDLTKWHFINRMCSMLLRKDMGDVAKNGAWNYEVVVKQCPWLSNIDIMLMQPAKYSMDDFISKLKRNGLYDHDAFIIDYDTNFLSESDMYEKAEETYNKAKQLVSRPGKICLIASQPKQYSWSEQTIGLADAAESSRKQQIVDMMITISRVQGVGVVNHIGILNVVKFRGGRLGQSFYMKDLDGRLVEISADTFGALKIESQTRSLFADSSSCPKLNWNINNSISGTMDSNVETTANPTYASNIDEATAEQIMEQNPNVKLDNNFNIAPNQTVQLGGSSVVIDSSGNISTPNSYEVQASELFIQDPDAAIV